MATSDQMRALMAVACPWCQAGPGQRCTSKVGRGARPISTLDGESHDARWQKALGVGARVLGTVVEAHLTRQPEPVGSVLTTTLRSPEIECPY